MQKIYHITVFLCLCIFQVKGNGVCESPVSEETAVGFIKKMVNEALDIVNNQAASDVQKRKALSECINKYLDIERIAKAVFSPKGYRELAENDQRKVNNFLKKYLIRFYASEGKLSAMMNSKLSKEPVAEKKDSKDFSVTTQFEKNASPALKMVWITDGKKVFYVEIEGINQIITLRAEMDNAIGSFSLMDYINRQEN